MGIAGLGFGEKVHLPALRACTGMEPVALWHPRQHRLDQACRGAELWGTTDFEQLLAQADLDAVVIATPPAVRFELAKQALLAGKHVLLEKPVALNRYEAQELVQLARTQRCCCAVNFEYRAVPAFQQLADLLQQDWLGEIWLVRFDWLMQNRSDPRRPWNWYANQAEGGGVLGAYGSHALDMMEWLVGPVLEVQAQLSVAIQERPLVDGSGFGPVDAADTALIQLKLQSQWANTTHVVPAQMALSAVAKQGRGCWLEIYGSAGTLILGSANQADYVHGFGLQGCRTAESMVAIAPDPAFAFGRSWADGRTAPVSRLMNWWAAAIREEKPMVPGLLEGLQSQIAIDACLDSHLSGNSVLLEY